jgi:predicted nucleic acid-binding protein
MMAVSNTGPLIALAKINRLDLLAELFGEIEIPQAVQRELYATQSPEIGYLDDALARFIRVAPNVAYPPHVQIATRQLDLGEQHAIGLAHTCQALLLMDDRAGRSVARRLGLGITGVAGILMRAKELNRLDSVRSSLDEK